MIHAGKFENTYFIMDVESGALHLCDEAGYLVAKQMEEGETENEAIVRALSSQLSYAQIRETIAELDELKAEGLLFSKPAWDPAKPVFYKPVIKALCLHIAHDCNLRCSYCFASEGSYRGKRGLMSKEVARAALDFLMKSSGSRRQLEVDFFGGEPLINFDVVRDAVIYGRSLEAQYGKTIRFTMTTNAYHVTDEMIEFINREMKNLVISIDGRREIHDAQRKNAAGQGSYDRVLENAKRLIASRGDKEYYIRGTFTANNLDFANDVLSIADEGFDQISIEPVVTEGPLGLTPEQLPTIRAEYERLGRIMEERRTQGRAFHFFHFMVDFAHGPCLNKRLRGCGAGAEYAAVAPNGDLFPCHQFADRPEYRIGSVFTGIEKEAIRDQFASCTIFSKPDCQNCFVKYFCSGGCAANALQMSGDINKPCRMSCELMRARFDVAVGLYIRKNFSEEAL